MRIIYLITCSCGIQYVEKTLREFRRRVGEHLGDIRLQRNTPVAQPMWTEHGGNAKSLKFAPPLDAGISIDRSSSGRPFGFLNYKRLLQGVLMSS